MKNYGLLLLLLLGFRRRRKIQVGFSPFFYPAISDWLEVEEGGGEGDSSEGHKSPMTTEEETHRGKRKRRGKQGHFMMASLFLPFSLLLLLQMFFSLVSLFFAALFRTPAPLFRKKSRRCRRGVGNDKANH